MSNNGDLGFVLDIFPFSQIPEEHAYAQNMILILEVVIFLLNLENLVFNFGVNSTIILWEVEQFLINFGPVSCFPRIFRRQDVI